MPATATRQAVCLQASLDNVVGAGNCGGPGGIFLLPSYDPVRREVTYRQQAGNAPMVPETRYELTVYAAINDGDTGIRSFDGIPLETPAHVEFGVLATPAGAVLPAPPAVDHFCGAPDPTCNSFASTCVRSVNNMLQGCALAGCHLAARDAGTPEQPSEGLQLGTPAGLLGTAIGHTAHETETGENANIPQDTSLRFGRAMPILAPEVPGNSYLIYKLLANHAIPLTVPFPTGPGDASGDPPEVARLRRSVVVGMPMPPSTGPLLHAGELEWLGEWLLLGGRVQACQ